MGRQSATLSLRARCYAYAWHVLSVLILNPNPALREPWRRTRKGVPEDDLEDHHTSSEAAATLSTGI